MRFWNLRTNSKKTQQTSSCVFWLNDECPTKLLCRLGIGHWRRQAIRMWTSLGGFFRASLYVWYLQYWALCGSFRTVSRCHIIVFFNRHCSTLNLVKEKQGGLIPTSIRQLLWVWSVDAHLAEFEPELDKARIGHITNLIETRSSNS